MAAFAQMSSTRVASCIQKRLTFRLIQICWIGFGLHAAYGQDLLHGDGKTTCRRCVVCFLHVWQQGASRPMAITAYPGMLEVLRAAPDGRHAAKL